jgi:putative addiction module killer protein
MYEIIDYVTQQGRARILVRLQRLSAGNFGDCKPIRDGVWELRIDQGPGCRIYYARAGEQLLLLLVGGNKHKQQADIAMAVSYWKDWNARNAS